MTLQEWKTCKESILPLTREETNRYVYLCDLLHNFILQHLFRSYFYVTSSNILPRVATLLKGRDKHLRHCKFSNTFDRVSPFYAFYFYSRISHLSPASEAEQRKFSCAAHEA